jgi:hypothetical protein
MRKFLEEAHGEELEFGLFVMDGGSEGGNALGDGGETRREEICGKLS